MSGLPLLVIGIALILVAAWAAWSLWRRPADVDVESRLMPYTRGSQVLQGQELPEGYDPPSANIGIPWGRGGKTED